MSYDSRVDTYAHIHAVQDWLLAAIEQLQHRLLVHDQTKLREPELATYDRMTPRLATVQYGSDDYKAALEDMGPALEHHYAHNRHHPQFYERGIRDMTLVDLLEMLCDWMAASQRGKGGDVARSIDVNRERFGYSDELADILHNTVDALRDD